MIILSIETSCDETAISIIEAEGNFPHAHYHIRGNALFSQIDMHREYGGVFPALAKREHTKTVIPMLEKALAEAAISSETYTLRNETKEVLANILSREHDLKESIVAFLEKNGKPHIDMIAVTDGPGLEPALWVGVNFARALSVAWDIPIIPVNHMEGHILASLLQYSDSTHQAGTLTDISFPALALLISGGHTEFDLMSDWGTYTCVGSTRDDAIGEAFDKVARTLSLPYPGGPEIAKRALKARERTIHTEHPLPRPMLHSADLDFSFSGIKTAVLYMVRDIKKERALTEDDVQKIAREFEEAVTDVLITKTKKALEMKGAKTLILGGGVSANTCIRESLRTMVQETYPHIAYFVPSLSLATDNAIMIALVGHSHYSLRTDAATTQEHIVAHGGKRLSPT